MRPSLIFLAMGIIVILNGCAEGVDREQRRAVHDREMKLPIDLCIQYASGDLEIASELRAAGFSVGGRGEQRRSFTELDNALSTQGYVAVKTTQDCKVSFPIHVMALQESNSFIRNRLSKAGFQQVSDARANTLVSGCVPFSDGRTTITVSSFGTRDVFEGVVSTVVFEALR